MKNSRDRSRSRIQHRPKDSGDKARSSRRSDGFDLDGDDRTERYIWKGTVAFGLVEIPVGLVSAVTGHPFKTTMLDRRDFEPVGYRRYNKSTGKEVDWSDIVKGYQHKDGSYVVLDDDELRDVNPRLTQTIQILEFVDQADIEPLYYERPYYLESLKRGKSYALLREVLRKTGKVGIAKVVVRAKEYLSAVGVRDDIMILYGLRFASEIRKTSELRAAGHDPHVTAQELSMAQQLVEGMTSKWKPEQYTDEFANDLAALIKKKAKMGGVRAPKIAAHETKREERSNVLQLMPLLKRSIEDARAAAPPRRRGRQSRSA